MLLSVSMKTDFPDWLQSELDKRGMKPAELARLARKDQGLISRILNRERKPSLDTLNAIGRALKLPANVVIQAFNGQTKSEDEEFTERAEHLIQSYKQPATKEKALEYLEFLAIQEEKAEYRVTTSSKPAKEPRPK